MSAVIESMNGVETVAPLAGVETVVAAVAIGTYLFLHNFPEKQVARHFLADLNGGHFDQAYRDWGCTTEHPCKNYDYGRFMEDWGPSKKASSPWKIASVDGCRRFVTVNVVGVSRVSRASRVGRRDRERWNVERMK